MAHYTAYYTAQIGGGSGIRQVYEGSRYQLGHGGIGSFLSGLFRTVLPYIKSGAWAVGKEAISAGFNVLDDVISGNSIKQSVKNNARQSGINLKNKAARKITEMMGGGYKRRGIKRKRQSNIGRASARTNKKPRSRKTRKTATKRVTKKRRTQRTVYDIFNK